MQNSQQATDKKKILVVDDDITSRLILREVLWAEGFEVEEAADGEEALEAFAASPPGLVLLDIEMPGMSGLEVCEKMRAPPDAGEIPVVMVSGLQDTDTINKAYSLGVADFVIKPINPTLLSHRLRGILDAASAGDGNQGAAGDLLTAMPDQVFVVNTSGCVVEHAGDTDLQTVNPGTSPEDPALVDLWPESVAAALLRCVKRVLKTRDGMSYQFKFASPKGERHYEARFVPRWRDRVMMILRDNTTESQTRERLNDMGLKDQVTGLPNRLAFLKSFAEQLADTKLRERSLALVVVGLGEANNIRSNFGRRAGDAVIAETAERLSQCVRKKDSVAHVGTSSFAEGVARLEGDAFVLVLDDVTSAERANVAIDRIKTTLSEPVRYKRQKHLVEPSVGFALFPDHGHDVESLLLAAERNSHETGKNGGNDGSRTPADGNTTLREDLLGEIRWGFAQGQFELHYLPKINLDSGQYDCVEALIRWRHPLRGLVPVSDFLPLIQHGGLMTHVGNWVLRTACEDLRGLRESGSAALCVSVNVSLQQLISDNFVETVREAMETNGLGPGSLEVDVTEEAVLHDLEVSIEKLQALKALGVRIALDDYGTGSASVQQLSRLPFDMLKIDCSLVNALPDDTHARAVCGAIIDLARRFGAGVVAEGVESDAQFETLWMEGCDQMQGFLFTEPLPRTELTEFLENSCTQRNKALPADPDFVRGQAMAARNRQKTSAGAA